MKQFMQHDYLKHIWQAASLALSKIGAVSLLEPDSVIFNVSGLVCLKFESQWFPQIPLFIYINNYDLLDKVKTLSV